MIFITSFGMGATWHFPMDPPRATTKKKKKKKFILGFRCVVVSEGMVVFPRRKPGSGWFGDWDCVKDLVCWAYGAPCDQSHPDPFASVTSTPYNNQLFYFILCNFFL
jgi:hypothetical protein